MFTVFLLVYLRISWPSFSCFSWLNHTLKFWDGISWRLVRTSSSPVLRFLSFQIWSLEPVRHGFSLSSLYFFRDTWQLLTSVLALILGKQPISDSQYLRLLALLSPLFALNQFFGILIEPDDVSAQNLLDKVMCVTWSVHISHPWLARWHAWKHSRFPEPWYRTGSPNTLFTRRIFFCRSLSDIFARSRRLTGTNVEFRVVPNNFKIRLGWV